MTETQRKLLERSRRKLQTLREDCEVLADAADGVDAINLRGIAARLSAVAALLEERRMFAPDGVAVPSIASGEEPSS